MIKTIRNNFKNITRDKEYKENNHLMVDIIRLQKVIDLCHVTFDKLKSYNINSKFLNYGHTKYLVYTWMHINKLLETNTKDQIIPNIEVNYIDIFEELFMSYGIPRDIIEDVTTTMIKYNNHILDILQTVPHIDMVIKEEIRQKMVTLKIVNNNSIKKILKDSEIRDYDFKFIFEKITKKYYNKLKKLFIYKSMSQNVFRQRVFSLLRRLKTMDLKEYRKRIPYKLFDYLKSTIGIQHECFATPLNCYLDSYSSLWYDSDKWFGSKGNFFSIKEYFPDGGSFQVFPPSTMLFVLIVSEYILDWVTKEKYKPLSFVFFMTKDKKYGVYDKLLKNKFTRLFIDINIIAHQYSFDFVYNMNLTEHKPNPTETTIVIIQNDIGHKKWGVPNPDDLVQHFNN